MGWIKVATSFTRHPKALKAGPTARHLYLCSLMWAGEYDTDGAIPAYALGVLATDAGIPIDEVQDVADKLMEVGLWERTADGWQVHDWSEWQSTADERERKAELNRERQRRFAERQREALDEALTSGNTDADPTDQRRVPNASEMPTESESDTESVLSELTERELEAEPPAAPSSLPPKRKRNTRISEDFKPTEMSLAWARSKFPYLRLDDETERFIDWNLSKGVVYADHQRAWQSWIRKADDWARAHPAAALGESPAAAARARIEAREAHR